jgi:hypothetical protein
LVPLASGQNISSSLSTLDTPNTNENLNTEYKTYILIFGQKIIGNLDNSTKIVSSIIGHNLINRRRIFRGNKFGSISAIRNSSREGNK